MSIGSGIAGGISNSIGAGSADSVNACGVNVGDGIGILGAAIARFLVFSLVVLRFFRFVSLVLS